MLRTLGLVITSGLVVHTATAVVPRPGRP